MKINIYIINSKPQSGKTTFENRCKELIGMGRCYITSSIDFVKYIAKMCGWDGSKTPKHRKFLSDLKDLLIDWDDVPFKVINNFIKEKIIDADNYDFDDTLSFFIDIREPEEIDKFKIRFKEQGYNVKTIYIARDVYEKNNINHADLNVENYQYDKYIDNNGSIENFYNIIDKFIKEEQLA